MVCTCSECGEILVSIPAFRIHHTIVHSSIRNFLCKNGTCCRSYDSWYSFRKHLINTHNVPLQYVPSVTVCDSVSNHDINASTCVSHNSHNEYLSEDVTCDALLNNTTPEDFHDLVSKQSELFVSKLYAKPGLPRSHIGDVVKDISSFLCSGFVNLLKSKVLNSLHEINADSTTIADITLMFESLENPFAHLSTEYRRFQHFQSSGFYIPPTEYLIIERQERSRSENNVKSKMKRVTGQSISLRDVFKQFLQLPNAFKDILNHMECLAKETGSISNIMQGEVWKEKLSSYSPESIVLPICVYFDEFEPNNPLGPHCEKLGAVYVSLPCLPTECQSRLENIFLALLFNGDDRKLYGNKRTFAPLIEELKYLESSGVTFTIPEGKKHVYFVTAAVLGDNLGVHGMCGFVESFSANYPCRFCKASKGLTETITMECKDLLRTNLDYEHDLALNDPSRTGIKERCIYYDLKSCDVTSTVTVDWMHDAAEGVAHYSMLPILKHFYQKDPLFLEILNIRMYMFDYGPDEDNRPPYISPEMLDRSKLKMTAAEMITFVKYFGLFVADKIDSSSQFFQMYTLLHKMFVVFQAKVLPLDVSDLLAQIIKEHHDLYVSLTGETLKPKHHFILHYPSIIKRFGPISHVSSMRFEARHRILKMYTNVSMSRKNLPLSVAIKQQLALCHRFVLRESILPKLVLGPDSSVNLSDLEQFPYLRNTLPANLRADTECCCHEWIDFKGSRYRHNTLLVVGLDDIMCPVFAEVKFIIINDGEPLFLCAPIENLGYNSSVNVFELQRCTSLRLCCIRHQDLFDPFPLHSHTRVNGDQVTFVRFLL